MTSSNYSLSADELHLPSSSDLIDPISSIDSSATLFQFNTDPKHIVDEDYYELESIFATNVDIACTFEQKTPLDLFSLLGRRAPELISEKGHRMNVPAWIIPAVDHISALTVPTIYNAVNRDVIHAGAQAVNLDQLQRHYYTLGTFICRLTSGDQGRQISLALLSAFSQRIGRILRDSVSVGAKPTRLDETEKRIFATIQRMELRKESWMANSRDEIGIRQQRRSTKRKHCPAAPNGVLATRN